MGGEAACSGGRHAADAADAGDTLAVANARRSTTTNHRPTTPWAGGFSLFFFPLFFCCTLAVPECRLTVVALVPGEVRAALSVDPDVGIDGVP